MNSDIVLSILLVIYTVVIVYVTKLFYSIMISKNIKKDDALYYNRKFVHILAGGVVTLFVPLYSTPYFPLIAGFLLTIFTYISHREGGKLYWFQSNRDFNDVNFCLMWGISIFILWVLLDSPWIAIIPAAFMAFGDGITGIIRNWLFKKRFKHPIGNVFMAIVCIPIGFIFGSYAGIAFGGVIAAIIASIGERYEYGLLDDNIIITISSALVLVLYATFIG
jgi:phytol kinase